MARAGAAAIPSAASRSVLQAAGCISCRPKAAEVRERARARERERKRAREAEGGREGGKERGRQGERGPYYR